MVTGAPVPRSVGIRTSAEPSRSVRSVARESAAMIVSALFTASAALLVPSAPQADVVTSAAAVNPAQAVVHLGFMSPHPCCDSTVAATLAGTTDSVRITDDGRFFPSPPCGSRSAQQRVITGGKCRIRV